MVSKRHDATKHWTEGSLQIAYQIAHVLSKDTSCSGMSSSGNRFEGYTKVSMTHHYTIVFLILDIISIQTCYFLFALSYPAFMA